MLTKLNELNKDKKILPVDSAEFARYGKVYGGLQFPEMEKFVRNTQMPENEFYEPCTKALTEMGKEALLIQESIFGQVPCQIGYYNGRCTKLNALEYHKCSEFLILLENVVLILGGLWDIENEKVDSSKLRYFYAPKGTCVELYATTLHWAPCMTGEEGVRQVVAQSAGTNTPLLKEVNPQVAEDKFLLERNKWVLIHEEAKASMSPNAYVGITGINPEICWKQEA